MTAEMGGPDRAVSVVPQTFVLESRLHTLHVSELASPLSSRGSMLAGNIEIRWPINSEEVIIQPQEDLNIVERRATSNRPPISHDKSLVTQISPEEYARWYAVYDVQLQVAGCTRDFGTLVQGNLKTGSQNQDAGARSL